MAAYSIETFAASPSLLDSCSHSVDDSRQSSAARSALAVFPAAVVAPAFAPVSAAASAAARATAAAATTAGSAVLAAYCPVDSAPNSLAVPARTTAQPPQRSLPAPSASPRIGVFVSLLFTSADSGFSFFLLRPSPSAADPSAARNSTKHQNSPAPAGSGLTFRLHSHSTPCPACRTQSTASPD